MHSHWCHLPISFRRRPLGTDGLESPVRQTPKEVRFGTIKLSFGIISNEEALGDILSGKQSFGESSACLSKGAGRTDGEGGKSASIHFWFASSSSAPYFSRLPPSSSSSSSLPHTFVEGRGRKERKERGPPSYLRRVMESTLFNSEILPFFFSSLPYPGNLSQRRANQKGKGKGGWENEILPFRSFSGTHTCFSLSHAGSNSPVCQFRSFFSLSQAASSPFTRSQRTRASPAATRYAEHTRYT